MAVHQSQQFSGVKSHRLRRGRAMVTLIGAAVIGIATTYLILQSQLSAPHTTKPQQLSQLGTPSTETYGGQPSVPTDAPQAVATNKPEINSPTAAPPSPASPQAPDLSDLATHELKPREAGTLGSPERGGHDDSPVDQADRSVLTSDARELMLLSRPPIIEDPHGFRDWTTINGARAEAAFIRRNQDGVILRDTQGNDHTIPLSRLSEFDREFVKAVAK